MKELVERLAKALGEKKWTAATAESCTGGLIGHELTNVAGSSVWYTGGIIAYANEVKEFFLGVPGEVLLKQGAVSEETVQAMAEGACNALGADVGVAVSGIAGPDGGTPDKPVGTVWIAWTLPQYIESEVFHFKGDRASVKQQTAKAAIEGLLERVLEPEIEEENIVDSDIPE